MSRSGKLASIMANRWMFAPVALLGLSVTVAVATVMTSVAGQSLGAEPKYDSKAADWDKVREQRAMNERLRWVVTPEVVSQGAHRVLHLTVEDKHGVRIDGAAVAVECVPVRVAERRIDVRCAATDAGRYEAAFDSAIGGQWEFRVVVERDGQRYTDEFRRPLEHVEAGRG